MERPTAEASSAPSESQPFEHEVYDHGATAGAIVREDGELPASLLQVARGTIVMAGETQQQRLAAHPRRPLVCRPPGGNTDTPFGATRAHLDLPGVLLDSFTTKERRQSMAWEGRAQ